MDFSRPAAGIRAAFLRPAAGDCAAETKRGFNEQYQWFCDSRLGLWHPFLRVLLRLPVQCAWPGFFHHRAGADQRSGAKTGRLGAGAGGTDLLGGQPAV